MLANYLKKSFNSVLEIQTRALSLSSVAYGVPKHRVSWEIRRKKKNNPIHQQKIAKGWHNWIDCPNCGEKMKKFHMCGNCYKHTRFETQQFRKYLDENDLDLCDAVAVQYKDDTVKSSDFVVDRNRPVGWFDQALWNSNKQMKLVVLDISLRWYHTV